MQQGSKQSNSWLDALEQNTLQIDFLEKELKAIEEELNLAKRRELALLKGQEAIEAVQNVLQMIEDLDFLTEKEKQQAKSEFWEYLNNGTKKEQNTFDKTTNEKQNKIITSFQAQVKEKLNEGRIGFENGYHMLDGKQEIRSLGWSLASELTSLGYLPTTESYKYNFDQRVNKLIENKFTVYLNKCLTPFNLPSLYIFKKISLPIQMGIYFIINNQAILYIGKASNLRERWIKHEKWALIKAKYPFSKIAWATTPTNSDYSLLDITETSLIQYFQPPLNTHKKKISQKKKVKISEFKGFGK